MGVCEWNIYVSAILQYVAQIDERGEERGFEISHFIYVLRAVHT